MVEPVQLELAQNRIGRVTLNGLKKCGVGALGFRRNGSWRVTANILLNRAGQAMIRVAGGPLRLRRRRGNWLRHRPILMTKRARVTLKDLLGLGSRDGKVVLSAGVMLSTAVVLLLVAGALARLLDTGRFGSLVLQMIAVASVTPLALLVERRRS